MEQISQEKRVLKATCLSCGKTYGYEEKKLWSGEEIKCPVCSAPFLIVK